MSTGKPFATALAVVIAAVTLTCLNPVSTGKPFATGGALVIAYLLGVVSIP